MIEEVLDIVREQARATQILLSNASQRAQVLNPIDLYRYGVEQKPLSNIELLNDLLRTSAPTLGANIRDYGSPAEETIGVDGPAIDPESPQRNE